MYLIINKAILPHFIGVVKRKKLITLIFKNKENLLKIIAKFIEKNKIEIKRIKGIIVIFNSLTFSETRTILTIVNIIGIFLNIPLSLVRKNEIKNIDEAIKIGKRRLKKEIILPTYHKEPNITISGKHK